MYPKSNYEIFFLFWVSSLKCCCITVKIRSWKNISNGSKWPDIGAAWAMTVFIWTIRFWFLNDYSLYNLTSTSCKVLFHIKFTLSDDFYLNKEFFRLWEDAFINFMQVSEKRLKALRLFPKYLLLFLFASHPYEKKEKKTNWSKKLIKTMMTESIISYCHNLISTFMSQKNFQNNTHHTTVFFLLIDL